MVDPMGFGVSFDTSSCRMTGRTHDIPDTKSRPYSDDFSMVDPMGFEPITSSMPWKRSTK